MELKDALLKRRSIRKFSDCKVTDEEINELMIAAMSGPSAMNRRPWEFFVIKDEEKLKEVRKNCAPFGKFESPLAIIVCGKLPLMPLPKAITDFWVQDCSAATENILLRAVDLNLGSVWCAVYPNKAACDATRKVLNVKKNIIPLNVIFIGHGLEEKEARSQFDANKIHII